MANSHQVGGKAQELAREQKLALALACNPQRRRRLSSTIGQTRRQAYLSLGPQEDKLYPGTYTRQLLLKKPGCKALPIAKLQYKAGQPIWFEGSWGQTEILGSAAGKTIWQIKRAVLTAYRRQYQTTIAHYQAQLEGLKGIKLNGEY